MKLAIRQLLTMLGAVLAILASSPSVSASADLLLTNLPPVDSRLLVTPLITDVRLVAEVAAEDKYYGANLCSYPEFHCIKIQPGDTWAKLFPNEREREIVKRLNRTNTPVSYRSWIVVPTNLSAVQELDLSPFPATIKSTGKRLVIVNLGMQAFGAYDAEGTLVHWGPVSGGKGWCPDAHRYCYTAVGSFRVISKEGPECISNKFPMETEGGAPMPYCIYYYRGFALHGSTLPGFHASHGCIRLFIEDAEWLNKKFLEVGDQVIVTR